MSDTATTLRDLSRAQALFQARAIAAVIGAPSPPVLRELPELPDPIAARIYPQRKEG